MKISIVTPSYNQADFLEETILSVINQRYKDLEYIIVDGGSTDQSKEIIEKYRSHLFWYVSEPDNGQADAINKGMSKATGEICAFINSDDLYLPGTLQLVEAFFSNNPDCEWVCGDTIFFGQNITPSYQYSRVPTRPVHGLIWEYHTPQPGMFWRRRSLNVSFDTSYNYCFDHDFYMRLLLAGKKCVHLKHPVAAYRIHSTSKTFTSQNKFDNEFDHIAQRYKSNLSYIDRRKVDSTNKIRKWHKIGNSESSPIRAIHYYYVLTRLLLILLRYPELIIKRAWWGTLRSLIRRIYKKAKL